MRIGFSGAANCGKTTMARQVAAAFGLPLIEEGFVALNRRLGAAKKPADVLTVFAATLEAKRREEKARADGFVADRTPVDLFAYLCTVRQNRNLPLAAAPVRDFEARARSFCAGYDAIVVPPWGVVTYNSLETWNPLTGVPRMDPMVNRMRHMAILGLAIDWLGPGKVLRPAPEVIRSGRLQAWLAERLGTDVPNTAGSTK